MIEISSNNLPIYCKSCSLPQGEILEGPEHATKAIPGLWVYDVLQDKFFMVEYIVSEAQLNLLEHICVHMLLLILSDQSSIKGSNNKQNLQDEYNTPKKNIHYQESTTRLPKKSNLYGNGGSILGYNPRIQVITKVIQPSRSFIAAAGNGTANEMKLVLKDKKFVNLYQLICSKDLLIQAYRNVRSNPGGMTPGIDNITYDGINDEFFEKLILELKSERFKFTSVKRVYIPKANGKTRPLGIPTSKDKIVQEAMKILLELIYEPIFLDVSHGFRPKRSCHTALHQISKWNGTTWMLEGDIKGFFNEVDHQVLIKILEKKIRDQRFFDLLWKLFRAGYIDDGVKYNTYTGVPQGGVISPVLSNIYLHEFDLFVETLIVKYSSGKDFISKVNPVIVKYSSKLSRLNDKYQTTKDKEILKEIIKLRAERNKLPSRIRNGIRVRYTRYADDWVIGIIGDQELVAKIKEECKAFLRDILKLELSEEKTKITNITEKDVRFLGVDINRKDSGESKIIQRQVKGRLIKSRINNNRLYFYVPVRDIIKKLEKAGFIKTYTSANGREKLAPNAITKWIFLDHRSILLRYNAVIRGLLNYYSFVDNKIAFHSIVNFLIHHSCAKTIARKLNLPNRAQAFNKFGRYLTAPGEGKLKPMELFTLDSFKKTTSLLKSYVTNPVDPFTITNWSLRTQINLFEPCWVCGNPDDIEMHHVKHLRKGGVRSTGFTALMSMLNRKQIPVCKGCHVKIHKGLYNDMKLNELHVKKNKEK